ncbi:hypothetical protein K490DRAFT_61906 [Saccharata proteae CBS 121410]|uniref:Uncharacterized protein n=1 Tax=Saccharata proteae CBS 121410 TaxID=1314787 RepID=A0A9P4HZ66_9PEZI|nr:hypothetical protein K490DRAFT_61906 [Saccharata proteae CBS 121410]
MRFRRTLPARVSPVHLQAEISVLICADWENAIAQSLQRLAHTFIVAPTPADTALPQQYGFLDTTTKKIIRPIRHSPTCKISSNEVRTASRLRPLRHIHLPAFLRYDGLGLDGLIGHIHGHRTDVVKLWPVVKVGVEQSHDRNLAKCCFPSTVNSFVHRRLHVSIPPLHYNSRFDLIMEAALTTIVYILGPEDPSFSQRMRADDCPSEGTKAQRARPPHLLRFCSCTYTRTGCGRLPISPPTPLPPLTAHVALIKPIEWSSYSTGPHTVDDHGTLDAMMGGGCRSFGQARCAAYFNPFEEVHEDFISKTSGEERSIPLALEPQTWLTRPVIRMFCGAALLPVLAHLCGLIKAHHPDGIAIPPICSTPSAPPNSHSCMRLHPPAGFQLANYIPTSWSHNNPSRHTYWSFSTRSESSAGIHEHNRNEAQNAYLVLRGKSVLLLPREHEAWNAYLVLRGQSYRGNENPFYSIDEIMDNDLHLHYIIYVNFLDLIRFMLNYGHKRHGAQNVYQVLRGISYRGKEQDVSALRIPQYTVVYKKNPLYPIDEIMNTILMFNRSSQTPKSISSA